MAHKLKIETQRLTFTYDAVEEELIDEPIFVQLTRSTYVGIYPEPYDYGETQKGLLYRCYTLKNRFSKHWTIKFDEIGDWTLLKLDEEKLNGELGDLIGLIRNRLSYLHGLHEAQFLDHMSHAITACVPVDRMKVGFNKRTHD